MNVGEPAPGSFASTCRSVDSHGVIERVNDRFEIRGLGKTISPVSSVKWKSPFVLVGLVVSGVEFAVVELGERSDHQLLLLADDGDGTEPDDGDQQRCPPAQIER